MDRKLRNDLRLAVVRCRTELTEDCRRQLEGTFGIYADGRIAAETALPQLDAAGMRDRRAIVASLDHLAASGATAAVAVEQAWNELVAGKYEWASMAKRMREKGLVRGSGRQ